jgi:hypothetical protein
MKTVWFFGRRKCIQATSGKILQVRLKALHKMLATSFDFIFYVFDIDTLLFQRLSVTC